MTLVKVSGGTNKPHENKLFFRPPPSTIKYNKLQKGPPEIKEREKEQPGSAAVTMPSLPSSGEDTS